VKPKLRGGLINPSISKVERVHNTKLLDFVKNNNKGKEINHPRDEWMKKCGVEILDGKYSIDPNRTVDTDCLDAKNNYENFINPSDFQSILKRGFNKKKVPFNDDKVEEIYLASLSKVDETNGVESSSKPYDQIP
jgi:hypothetical protein